RWCAAAGGRCRLRAVERWSRTRLQRAHRRPLRGHRPRAASANQARPRRGAHRRPAGAEAGAPIPARCRLYDDRCDAMTRGRCTAVSVALAAALATSCSRGTASSPPFTGAVAPILFKNCAPCHHAGGPGPFALISYEDARKHARQIVKVTGRRFMPRWSPNAGHGRFVGERHLTDGDIATLAAWVAAGTPEGDRSRLAAAPVYSAGWQLGAPGLVLRAAQPLVVPAEGGDIFWNLVLPSTLTGTRYVRAM